MIHFTNVPNERNKNKLEKDRMGKKGQEKRIIPTKENENKEINEKCTKKEKRRISYQK